MTKLYKLFLAALVCFISSQIFSQFSRNDATDLVLNQILDDDLEKVNVYSGLNSLPENGTISLWNGENVQNPFSSSWYFFVDDRVFANWEHPCRYVFVDALTGTYNIVQQRILPQTLESDFEIIHEIARMPATEMGINTNEIIESKDGNPNLYAVFITGFFFNPEDEIRFWKDNSAMYTTLINVYGYTDENIFVHYWGGHSWQPPESPYQNDFNDDDADDMDYMADEYSISQTFQYLSTTLTPSDQLFIFIDGHGGLNLENNNPFLYLIDDDQLYDHELKAMLQNINCAQMIILMESCYSGGFADDLSDLTNVQCEERIIQTACLGDEPSRQEYWITNTNFNEFVYYWTAAARGWYPSTPFPWEQSLWQAGYLPFTELGILEFVNHPPDFNPDVNGDNFVQMEEAFDYANYFDTWSFDGYYNPKIDFDNPPGNWETPQKEFACDFTEDVYSLYGIAGRISQSQSISGNFAIGGPLYLSNNASLNIGSNSKLYLIDDKLEINGVNYYVKILIPLNHTMIFQDNIFVQGSWQENSIDVYGNIEFGINNRFWGNLEELPHIQWPINLLNNYNGYVVINEGYFNNCTLKGYPNYLRVKNCEFIESYIDIEQADADIKLSLFDNSFIKASNGLSQKFIHIDTCVLFSYYYALSKAISINSYKYYRIDGNQINTFTDAVSIFNSGTVKGEKLIQNNTIADNADEGIVTYNSYSDILMNYIHDNRYGVRSLDISNMTLIGNMSAHSPDQTQQIVFNTNNEVYASQNSFPKKFRWNAIGHFHNEIPHVCYVGQFALLDVRNNYWGTDFDPGEDLDPYPWYIYLPIWPLTEGQSGDNSIQEILYNSALTKIETEDYSGAKNDYIQLIDSYTESEFAKAALKDIFLLEELADNDFSGLKEYYLLKSQVQSNLELAKLADFLANFCDIKLENYPTAIAWFEDVIQNPESIEDSIFAIIDLGYTYFLMENGQKSSYVGNMPQYKPVSVEQFEENRDYLLSLLPGDKLSETMKENINALKTGELLQNLPNPFNGSTQIWYKLEEEASVSISIFDYTGKRVSSINSGKNDKGSHFIEFASDNLPSGIYFYTLEVNGKLSDSKKMTVMK